MTITTGRRMAAVAIAGAVAVFAGGALLTGSGASAPVAAPHKVIRVSSYELDTSLAAMTEFTDNADIVVADVASVEAARWNTADGTAPPAQDQLSYIFTPVRLTVREVLRGTAVAGQEITVRRYDGTVGDTTYESLHGPSPALQPGQRVVLFLQPDHPLDDGRADRIANAAYVVQPDGSLLDPEGEATETLAQLRALLGLA